MIRTKKVMKSKMFINAVDSIFNVKCRKICLGEQWEEGSLYKLVDT